MDPHAPLEEVTAQLAGTLHTSAAEHFPHTSPRSTPPNQNVPQNSWYDAECKETRLRLQQDESRGVRTHKQARSIFRRLVRRKKRAYLSKVEHEFYQLFLGQDSKEAWKAF